MSPDDRRPWWQRRAVLAAILIASILPLLWPPLPPLTDLPGHVARWHIATADAGSPLLRYYDTRWALIGNLGADLLAIPLAHLLGPVGAGKAIMLLIVLVTSAAMLWLAREAHGRIPPTALLALPFVYGWPFQMGFANFMLAQGLAFAALALWLRLGRGERLTLRAGVFAPIALLLWIAHSAGWGLFGLMAFGAELARLRTAGRRWPGAIGGSVLACLPLAVPVILMIANAPPPGARAGETGDWFNILAKFLWVISSLRDRWAWFDIVSMALLLIVLYMGARDKRLGYEARLGWPALFVLGAFLLLPRLALGGAYVDMRMMPAVWTLALLAIRPSCDRRFGQRLAIAALLFFGTRTAATMTSFVLRTAEQRAELKAVASIPRGAAVLALVYKPCLTPWSDIRPEHLPAYATIARDAFTNEQWAIDGQQYLHIRHVAARPFDADPSQLVYPAGCEQQGHSLSDALTRFPRAAFSHVWIIGNRLHWPRHYGLVPVWTNGRSGLYEVIGAAARRRVKRRP